MNEACQALKEPLEEVFRRFAYLELEMRQSSLRFSTQWTLCTRVHCGRNQDVVVVLMATPEFAATIADNYRGIPEGSRAGQRIDIMSELTNVLAGQAYEIARAGGPPKEICPPSLLSVREALEIWNRTSEACKFVLCTETEIAGGLLVTVKDEWSSQ